MGRDVTFVENLLVLGLGFDSKLLVIVHFHHKNFTVMLYKHSREGQIFLKMLAILTIKFSQ